MKARGSFAQERTKKKKQTQEGYKHSKLIKNYFKKGQAYTLEGRVLMLEWWRGVAMNLPPLYLLLSTQYRWERHRGTGLHQMKCSLSLRICLTGRACILHLCSDLVLLKCRWQWAPREGLWTTSSHGLMWSFFSVSVVTSAGQRIV